MSARRLKNVIEKSNDKITRPNDCYNSGIINAKFKLNTGINQDFKNVKISVCYGNPLSLCFWENDKIFLYETISTSKIKFENGIFKNRRFTIEL